MADGAESAAARAPVARKIWPTDDDVVAGVGERDLERAPLKITRLRLDAKVLGPFPRVRQDNVLHRAALPSISHFRDGVVLPHEFQRSVLPTQNRKPDRAP